MEKKEAIKYFIMFLGIWIGVMIGIYAGFKLLSQDTTGGIPCPECDGSSVDIKDNWDFCRKNCMWTEITPVRLIDNNSKYYINGTDIILTEYHKSIYKENVTIKGYYVVCDGSASKTFKELTEAYEIVNQWQNEDKCLFPKIITKYKVEK